MLGKLGPWRRLWILTGIGMFAGSLHPDKEIVSFTTWWLLAWLLFEVGYQLEQAFSGRRKT